MPDGAQKLQGWFAELRRRKAFDARFAAIAGRLHPTDEEPRA